jgi:hypothetical protein
MNIKSRISKLVFWTTLAVAQALSLRVAVSSTPATLVFGAVFAAVFALLSVALQSVVRYGNFDKYPALQRFTNYSGLAALAVIFPLGASYGAIFLIFEKAIFAEFLPFAAIEILLSLVFFVLLIFYFKNKEKYVEEADIQPIEQKENVEIIEQIAVKTGQKLNVVSVNDIFYLAADGDYVEIHADGKKFLKEQTMKYFAEHLPAERFLRVHRSYIVNTQKISRIEQYGKQSLMITLHNGEKLKVSAAGYKLLKSRLRI